MEGKYSLKYCISILKQNIFAKFFFKKIYMQCAGNTQVQAVEVLDSFLIETHLIQSDVNNVIVKLNMIVINNTIQIPLSDSV